MAFSRDWDETAPLDHSKFKSQPGYVRNTKVDVADRLKNMLYGFAAGETDEGFKYAQLKDQAGNPGTPAAGFVRLFCKAVQTTIMRLFIIDENAKVVEVSTESQSSDVASAATCDLSTATGRFVKITGTTGITSFGTSPAGTIRKLRFAGALTITYHATQMILPGAADIVTVADDRAEFISLGAGNWFCQNYHRASGGPLITNTKIFVWHFDSDVAVATQAHARFYMPFAGTIVKARAYAKTAPTGADLIFDINKNGSTIWATQGNRVKVAASANLGTQTSFDTTALAVDDYIDIDIDQVGSTVAGNRVTVQLEVKPT